MNLKDIEEMLNIVCLNYEIKFGNKIVQQKEGVPMGARFAPPFAIIYMFQIERDILFKVRKTYHVAYYKRFIDDTVIIYKPKQVQVTADNRTDILNIFNAEHDMIKFTIDSPNEKGYLAFLDMEIKLDPSKGIIYRFYQKTIHSGNILNFAAANPLSTKKVLQLIALELF